MLLAQKNRRGFIPIPELLSTDERAVTLWSVYDLPLYYAVCHFSSFGFCWQEIKYLDGYICIYIYIVEIDTKSDAAACHVTMGYRHDILVD